MALATDATTAAGKKERQQIADKAIFYFNPDLKPKSTDPNAVQTEDQNYDTPDSGVQAQVHIQIGKLFMAKGDFVNARKYFDEAIKGEVAKNKKPEKIEPELTPDQQLDARFFRVLTDVLDKKPAEAATALASLTGWVNTNITDKKAREQVEATLLMVQYRIASLQADTAKDDATKKKFDAQASDLLTQLSEKFPAYRGIITEQLLSRLGDKPDLTKQNMAVLDAIISKAQVELNKPENLPFDKKVLERGVSACEQVVKRSEATATAKDVKPERAENVLLLEALFDEKLGDEVAAANAYLAYANKYKAGDAEKSGGAMDRAIYLAVQLSGKKQADPAVKDLYGRTLAAAVGEPYRRKPAYYYYANLLRQQNKPRDAMPFFRAVPKGDPNEFNARLLHRPDDEQHPGRQEDRPQGARDDAGRHGQADRRGPGPGADGQADRRREAPPGADHVAGGRPGHEAEPAGPGA